MRNAPRLLLHPLALLAVAAGSLATQPALAADTPDAKVERIVLEDDAIRIDELKVRGQTQKVTVQPKNSKAPAYEIVMGDGSRELSAGPGSNRGAVGQRVWRVLSF